MRKVLFAGAAGLMATGVALAPGAISQAATNPDGRQAATVYKWGKPIAGDEFKYAGRPDKNKWSVYNGPGHHNQGRRVPTAWTVANGYARVGGDSKGNTGGMSAKWPGADKKYGKWEVRMRVVKQRDPRYHALALLWPQDGYKRGKCDGEVDFTENTRDLTLTHFYLHYSCANTQTTKAIKNDVTQWHNYAVAWTPTSITGYIDGKPWFKDTNRSHLPPRPMHVTLQLDYFPKDGSGPLKPSAIYYAWVRQYK